MLVGTDFVHLCDVHIGGNRSIQSKLNCPTKWPYGCLTCWRQVSNPDRNEERQAGYHCASYWRWTINWGPNILNKLQINLAADHFYRICLYTLIGHRKRIESTIN